MNEIGFNPCDIARWGKDNAVYVRAIDGFWYVVNIGYTGHTEAYGSRTGRTDADIQRSIDSGYAQVIYRSPGHY